MTVVRPGVARNTRNATERLREAVLMTTPRSRGSSIGGGGGRVIDLPTVSEQHHTVGVRRET